MIVVMEIREFQYHLKTFHTHPNYTTHRMKTHGQSHLLYVMRNTQNSRERRLESGFEL